jgi:hypothetical protein
VNKVFVAIQEFKVKLVLKEIVELEAKRVNKERLVLWVKLVLLAEREKEAPLVKREILGSED